MARGSKTVRAYMTPMLSNRAVVGLKPCSSAVVPKISEPPLLGLAVEMPLWPGPLVTAHRQGPVRTGASPARAHAAAPAAAAAECARNDLRSIDRAIAASPSGGPAPGPDG